MQLSSSDGHERGHACRGAGDVRQRLREAHLQQRERRKDGQRAAGQEVRCNNTTV